jgi:hypothetical protein
MNDNHLCHNEEISFQFENWKSYKQIGSQYQMRAFHLEFFNTENEQMSLIGMINS